MTPEVARPGNFVSNFCGFFFENRFLSNCRYCADRAHNLPPGPAPHWAHNLPGQSAYNDKLYLYYTLVLCVYYRATRCFTVWIQICLYLAGSCCPWTTVSWPPLVTSSPTERTPSACLHIPWSAMDQCPGRRCWWKCNQEVNHCSIYFLFFIFYRCSLVIFLFRQDRWKTSHGISTKLGQ